MLLVGDIGGTKTRLAICDKNGLRSTCFEKKFASRDFRGLKEIIQEFRKLPELRDYKIEGACFGVAGPVIEGVCKATNLPWVIDAAEIKKALDIHNVSVINDVEANAYGIAMLEENELFVLQKGVEKPGNQALIAAGTGLGEACLYWDGKIHRPFACEGGHADFGPRDELEMELLRYLKKQFTHVSYERILSGSGLYQIYRFLIDMQLEKEDPEIRKQFATEDPAKVISRSAIEDSCVVSTRAVHWFLSIYGAEAGNLALKAFSLGGLFIGGGIAPKLKEFLGHGEFLQSFLEKGRLRHFLEEVPIKIVLNDNAALLGALRYASAFMG